MEEAADRYSGYRFVYGSYVHARPNALQFGNQWSYLRHGEALAALHPDARFYHTGRGVFLDFTTRASDGGLPAREVFPADRPSIVIVLRGDRDALRLDLPPGLRLQTPPDLQERAREAGLAAAIVRPVP
jgi:hypothetical protein